MRDGRDDERPHKHIYEKASRRDRQRSLFCDSGEEESGPLDHGVATEECELGVEVWDFRRRSA